MNLIARIKAYLERSGDWVSEKLIRAQATKHGYTFDATTRALDTVSHTPPYASWYVSPGDTKANRVSGTYYRYCDVTPDELGRNKQALKAFDEL